MARAERDTGLDPQVAAILQEMEADEEPTWTSLAETRAAVNEAVAALTGPPTAIAEIADLAAPGPAGRIPLRCYRHCQPKPLATLLFLHGGGWTYGDLDAYDPFCHTLAYETRCTVVSVDYHYRLAPEHPFPAAVLGAWAATRWVVAHTEALGAPQRLAIAGESAGGNFAAAVCPKARQEAGPALELQLLIYPALDLAGFDRESYRRYGHLETLSTARMRAFCAQYLGSEGNPYDPLASPLRADTSAGLPAAIVVNAEHDVLRDEGEAYVRALRRDGVPVLWPHYPGIVHGFLNVGLCVDRAWLALAEIGRAVRECLGGEQVRTDARGCLGA